jgi:hypothetical protein
MSNSTDIDNALIAKLGADAALLTLMPNGVYYQNAPPGSKKYVLVSLADSVDQPMFGGRAWESVLYLVKAVEWASTINTPNVNIGPAANRLDALLDPQPPLPPATLTIPGYGLMVIRREGRRIRDDEYDEKDPTIHVQHRGGFYRVWATADLH